MKEVNFKKIIYFGPKIFFLYLKFNLRKGVRTSMVFITFKMGGLNHIRNFFSAKTYFYTLFICPSVSFKFFSFIVMIILTGWAAGCPKFGNREQTSTKVRTPNNFNYFTIFRSFLTVLFKKIPLPSVLWSRSRLFLGLGPDLLQMGSSSSDSGSTFRKSNKIEFKWTFFTEI